MYKQEHLFARYRDLKTSDLLDYVSRGDSDAKLEYHIRRKRSAERQRKLLNR